MLDRKSADPSPVRAGLLHGLISFAVFAGAGGIVGGLIHVTGDPAEAGPQQVIALFATEDGEVPGLRGRLASNAYATTFAETGADNNRGTERAEPSLGVADPTGATSYATGPSADAQSDDASTQGIRINGKLVAPGQSYSDLSPRAATVRNAGPTANEAGSETNSSPVINTVTAEGNSYARPFDNPQGKPIVSLVIGGLGTSYRHAISAIDELPAEVTLSFVPSANPELLRYARRKGHEILLEVPMETQGRGKTVAHRDTLLAGVRPADNVLRMDSLLRGKKELYGVISYKGDKFVTDEAATRGMLAHLNEKGLAFFQHGTLERASFSEAATELGMTFAAAQENIDTEIRASEIEAQLFKIETQALDEGSAFATGFAYPLTVDLVSRWSQRLSAKGILLAPASAVAAKQAQAKKAEASQLRFANATPSDATP